MQPVFSSASGALEPALCSHVVPCTAEGLIRVAGSQEGSRLPVPCHRGLGSVRETCSTFLCSCRNRCSSPVLSWKDNLLSALRSRHFTQQCFPLLFKIAYLQGFFFFPICAYFKVSKQRFLNIFIFFPYRTRHNNKPSHTDAINSGGRQTVCTFSSFCHLNKLFPKQVIDHLIRAIDS